MTITGNFALFLFVLFGCFFRVSGYAALIRPTARGMMWIKGSNSPSNYNYMGLNCGGLKVAVNLWDYCILYCYRNDPKFSDRYAWAKFGLITSIMVEPHCLTFRVITTIVWGVRIFRKLTVFAIYWSNILRRRINERKCLVY